MVEKIPGINMKIDFNTQEEEIKIKRLDNNIQLDESKNDLSVIFCNMITTSISPEGGDLVRLNLKLCYINDKGNFSKIRKTISFFQDPERNLEDEELKFLDFDLNEIKGKQVDWNLVENLFSQADVIISHNSSFTRPWVRKYINDDENIWACTLENVDWNSLDFPSRNLEVISVFSGFFYDFSSSQSSLDAAISCLYLNHQISSILKKSLKPDLQLYAANAPIEYKDNLKQNGYRWNPELKCWWKPIDLENSKKESEWLSNNIPSVDPQVFEVDPKFRFI